MLTKKGNDDMAKIDDDDGSQSSFVMYEYDHAILGNVNT